MLKKLDKDLLNSLLQSYGGSISNLNLSKNGLINIDNIVCLEHCVQKLNLSNNDINNITALSQLKQLKELYISNNEICNLDAIAPLTNLEILDVSGNNIATVEDAAVGLRGTTSLRVLKLSGNPLIISSVASDFPLNIFNLQPSLEYVDDWDRKQILPLNKVNYSRQKFDKPFERSKQPGSGDKGQEQLIRSLQGQLEAMETTFVIQERALAANGAELAHLCTSGCAKNPINLVIGGDHDSSEAQSVAQKTFTLHDAVEQFPYFRLLQLWRKQTQHAILARTFTEQRLSESMKQGRKERKELIAQLQENDANALMWKQRSNALQEHIDQLESQNSTYQQSISSLSQKNQLTEKVLSETSRRWQRLESFLQYAKSAVDNHFLQQSIGQSKAVEHLRCNEERLNAAVQRLEFATAVISQREVQLRNSAAAIEAEKRLLDWSRQQQWVSQAQDDRNAELKESDEQNSDVTSVLPSDITITPEAESLLRTVHRNLDEFDQGYVLVCLLSNCIFTHSDSGETNEELQRKQHDKLRHIVLTCHSGNQLLKKHMENHQPTSQSSHINANDNEEDTILLSPLGLLLSKALTADRMLAFVRKLLQRDPFETLTWGELLVMLLPQYGDIPCLKESSTCRLRTALTTSELKDLREAGLLDDVNWGMVPLDIDSTLQKQQKASKDSNSSDISRLSSERSYLLKRLQAMTRTLERRAEGIKSYFENNLRKEQLKVIHQQQQITELKDSLTISESRVEELTVLHQEHKTQSEERIAAANKEIDRLTASLNSRQRDEIKRYEELLNLQAGKYARLETEYNLCQRDCGKKEVKCRALQRDLLRIQSAQSAQSAELEKVQEELMKVRNELKEQDRSVQQQLAVLQKYHDEAAAAWAAEKIDLQAALLNANKELEDKRSQLSLLANRSNEANDKPDNNFADSTELIDETHSLADQDADKVAADLRAQMANFRRQYGNNTLIEIKNNDNIVDVAKPVDEERGHLDGEPSITPSVPQAAIAAHLSKLLRLAEQAMT